MGRKQYEIAVFHFSNALNELGRVEVHDLDVESEILLNFGHVREKQGELKQALELYEQAHLKLVKQVSLATYVVIVLYLFGVLKWIRRVANQMF